MTAESQTTEWKSDWRDEHLKWICGFANAQGGVLVIGRNDRGEVVGVRNILRLLEEIPNKVQSLLGIVVDVNLKMESELEYLEIVVKPYPNPISYKGEFHFRSGSTKQVLRGAALTRFLLERQGRTWDDAPMPGIRTSDLSRSGFDRFRKRSSRSGRLNQHILNASDSEIIERLRLREGPHLTRAAVLLFHPEPQQFIRGAFVKIGYFRGADVLYQDVVEGSLFSQVERTQDLLYSKYSRALITYQGLYRNETYPVPAEAMREAVTNAVIHRDYADPAPIQIRVYDDRLVIWNAGQLPTGWSVKHLTGKHPSRPYNPAIAGAFFRAGLIEAWGRGIQHIRQACESSGNPAPSWHVGPGNDLWIEFPFSDMYLAAARSLIAGDKPENSQKTARKQPENSQKTARKELHLATAQPEQEVPATARQQVESALVSARILAFLRQNPSASRRTIATELGVTPSLVRYWLDKLRKEDKIKREGPTKGGYWKVSDDSATRSPVSGILPERSQKEARKKPERTINRQKNANKQPPKVTRQPEQSRQLLSSARKPPEDSQLADRITALLSQNPSASRHTIAAMLDTTESTVRYWLDKLRKRGEIERIGSR